MAGLKVICICSLLGAISVLFLQKHAISRLGQQNRNLHQEKEEATRLASENGGIHQLRVENQALEALKAANQDLLKLRNEVRQLREQTPEVEKLREENQRLTSEIKSMADGKAVHLSQMDGYAGRETWSNGGFATPEAALQTFFWAIREGQFDQIADCISPEMRPSFDREYAKKSDQERKRIFQDLATIAGYRLAEREQPPQKKDAEHVTAAQRASQDTAHDENKVILGIQAAAGGAVIKWHLKRFGNEWKIEDW